jgi:hypothetical protein
MFFTSLEKTTREAAPDCGKGMVWKKLYGLDMFCENFYEKKKDVVGEIVAYQMYLWELQARKGMICSESWGRDVGDKERGRGHFDDPFVRRLKGASRTIATDCGHK